MVERHNRVRDERDTTSSPFEVAPKNFQVGMFGWWKGGIEMKQAMRLRRVIAPKLRVFLWKHRKVLVELLLLAIRTYVRMFR